VPPFIPGSDFAGDVVEIAEDVDNIGVGDRVLGAVPTGAYAEQVVTPSSLVFRLPDGVSYDDGAILPVGGLSASFLFSQAALPDDAWVVTYAAAGGLGCFLGGYLSAKGVRSIGLTSSDEKAGIAKAAGHAEVVNYTTHDVVQEVQRLTDGQNAHVVFDSVGGDSFINSFRMLRNEGCVVLCGRSAGDPSLDSVYPELIDSRRNLAVRDFFLNTHIIDHFGEIPRRVEELLAMCASGRFTVPTTTYSLDEVAEAHSHIESKRSYGKLILNTT
jgi:NADPH2:quinone reductase